MRARPRCYVCKSEVRGSMPEHLTTKRHQSAGNATSRPGTGRAAYSPRRAATASAYAALRRWDDQYADEDPGNSPEWDAAYAAAV